MAEAKRKLIVMPLDGEEVKAAIARTSLKPEVQATSTRQTYLPEAAADFADHVKALERQIQHVQKGDMSAPEAMLMAQAATLDALFNCMAQDAFRYIGMNGARAEASMKTALKSQAQCASTLRVLGELKHPRAVAFVQQANISNGPQQINNGVDPIARAPAREERPASTNELLTDQTDGQNGTTLDTGATRGAGRRNKAMAAVAAVDGPKDRGRESTIVAKCPYARNADR